MIIKFIARSAIAVLIVAQFLAAQDPRGRILGRVRDVSEALMPGVKVTATNTETGIMRLAKTSNEGFYRISNLSPGTYNLKAEKPGFSTSALEGLVGRSLEPGLERP